MAAPESEPQIVHTAHLDAATRAQVRTLLDEAFEGDFTDEDWSHTLGGLHALIRTADGAVIGHGSVIQRTLLHRGRAVRTGYLEGVAVRAGHRGHGHGAAVLRALEEIVRRAYSPGLRPGGAPQGPLSALTAEGPVRTADDDGGVFVPPVRLTADVPLDLSGELSCDWRDGDVW